MSELYNSPTYTLSGLLDSPTKGSLTPIFLMLAGTSLPSPGTAYNQTICSITISLAILSVSVQTFLLSQFVTAQPQFFTGAKAASVDHIRVIFFVYHIRNSSPSIAHTVFLSSSSAYSTFPYPHSLRVPFLILHSLRVPFLILRTLRVPFLILRSLRVPFLILHSLRVPFLILHSLRVPFLILRSLCVPFLILLSLRVPFLILH